MVMFIVRLVIALIYSERERERLEESCSLNA